MSNRKMVAVFSATIYEPMMRSIQAGINKAALENGVKVIYFSSFSDEFSSRTYDQYRRYDMGDVVSFELPDLDMFDGIIKVDLAYGTYTRQRLEERLAEAKIPVINVCGRSDKYYNILNDEEKTFSDVVEHIITEHGCEDIYHVAGIKGKYFTEERIEAYRAMLEKHGIKYESEKVYYGNLWRSCGDDALDYILESCKKRGKKYPDAIVCANDYSAIGVINACRSRGIEVPGDIVVTGFDGVEEAYQGYPSITTAAQPFYEAGYEAIYTFSKLWSGTRVPQNIKIRGRLMRKQSCGCDPMSTDTIDDIRSMFQSRIDKVSYLAQSTTNLILSISNAASMEECFDEITKNASKDTGFQNMLLCLAPDWNKKRVVGKDYSKTDEEMTIVAGFMGDKPVEHSTFNKRNILPPDLFADPNPYFVVAIHHLEYYMGYIIITPQIDDYDWLAMKSWIVNLGAMLENWRIREELNVTVRRMENLYNRDMLTDLYNRHGYEMFFNDFYEECKNNDLTLAVLMIDMDDLKYINDNLGHAEGDYSLCTIAEAMNVAARNGEICLRTGGDEFVVLAKDYSDKKVKDYSEMLREHIDARIKRDHKDYSIRVSIGSCIMHPSVSDTMTVKELSEEYMKLADAAMYEEKKEHKKKTSREN